MCHWRDSEVQASMSVKTAAEIVREIQWMVKDLVVYDQIIAPALWPFMICLRHALSTPHASPTPHGGFPVSYSIAVLQYHCFTVSLSYSISVSQYHRLTVSLSYNITVLEIGGLIQLCIAILFFWYICSELLTHWQVAQFSSSFKQKRILLYLKLRSSRLNAAFGFGGGNCSLECALFTHV